MKKVSLKKSISLLLALVMAISLAVPALAADKNDANPVLIISGFVEYTLVDPATGASAFGDTNAIMNTVSGVLPSLLTLLGSNKTQADYDTFCDTALPLVNQLFDKIACNPDGTVKYPDVTLKAQTKGSLAKLGTDYVMQADAFDKEIILGLADAVGADKVYAYGLDWRLDPLVVADDINDWIQMIKAETGYDKVSLAGVSMGGAMVSAYVAKYGTDDLSNITMISSAFTGLEYVGKLFTGGVSIDEQGLYNMIDEAVSTDILSNILGSTDILPQAIGLVDELVAAVGDRVYSECLIPSFGYNPGFWTFVPADYYEDAKAFMFARMNATEEQKATFEAKIDAYHNIQANIKTILKDAQKDGVSVAIISNYNFQMPPVSAASSMTGDQVIETRHTSGYATCANISETLPASYKNSKYVSPDRMIDASTCYLPDQTWFIKNMKHVDFSNEKNQCEFYAWVMTADKQITVNDNPDYPQFMVYNAETKVLSPLANIRGDVNFDGKVDLVDARMVLRYTRSMETLSDVAKEAADMDENSNINALDAKAIMNFYAGIEAEDNTPSLFTTDSVTAESDNDILAQAQESTSGLRETFEGVVGQIGEMLPLENAAQMKRILPDAKDVLDALPEITFPQKETETNTEPEADAQDATEPETETATETTTAAAETPAA